MAFLVGVIVFVWALAYAIWWVMSAYFDKEDDQWYD